MHWDHSFMMLFLLPCKHLENQSGDKYYTVPTWPLSQKKFLFISRGHFPK